MKTAISLSDATLHRVDDAARRMCGSRSELFARAAERWLDDLEGADTTAAIDRALTNAPFDHPLTDTAAAALLAHDETG